MVFSHSFSKYDVMMNIIHYCKLIIFGFSIVTRHNKKFKGIIFDFGK